MPSPCRFSALIASAFLASLPAAAQTPPDAAITAEAINAARLDTLTAAAAAPPATEVERADDDDDEAKPELPDATIARLQVLLDRQGASPGVIDGFDGDNVRKAILAVEVMHALPADGMLDAEVVGLLETGEPVIGIYTVTADDISTIVPPIPADYAEQAKFDRLGFTSVPEELAERFHMDVDLLEALNPGLSFAEGDKVFVAAFGADRQGKVARIEADKRLRQVRAYAADDTLIAAYPATIGSEDNPSPTGTHEVLAVAPNPTYTYNPKVNFQQGDNTEVLTLPPGPNGPVGTMWIDLSEPTYGIHGTPEPSLIDKTGSHGCVRLTNWDATELAAMVEPGVTVTFLD